MSGDIFRFNGIDLCASTRNPLLCLLLRVMLRGETNKMALNGERLVFGLAEEEQEERMQRTRYTKTRVSPIVKGAKCNVLFCSYWFCDCEWR